MAGTRCEASADTRCTVRESGVAGCRATTFAGSGTLASANDGSSATPSPACHHGEHGRDVVGLVVDARREAVCRAEVDR